LAMAPRSVLVTGCSSGVGLALAVRLATDPRGRFKVPATTRDPGRRGAPEKAAGAALGRTLEMGELDGCDEDSVARYLRQLPAPGVDVNAGVGLIGPPESLAPAETQHVTDTDFFGLVRLRRRGHIAVISSVLGLQGITSNDIYAASKFAVEGFCESLLVQALRFNISLTPVEPGPVGSEFEGKPYAETADVFTRIYLPNSRALFSSLAQTPEEVAEVGESFICAPRPPFRTQTEPAYTPMLALQRADPSGDLVGDAFYLLVFGHSALLRASLGAIRLCRWKARKPRRGTRLLGFRWAGGHRGEEGDLRELGAAGGAAAEEKAGGSLEAGQGRWQPPGTGRDAQ
uniref:Retinol dehydrogenase 8 n=1 Tax=Ornithorhynchus anatinus TaxID=9258 RepID=F6PTX1_ORNAN